MQMNRYPKKVWLKNGQSVSIRPLDREDFGRLYDFLKDLSEEDRLFLRHDVRDPDVVCRWMEELERKTIIPLLALDDDTIIGSGRIHLMKHSWMQHVGHMRLIISKPYRRQGLGGLFARELVGLAEERGLQKLQAHVIEDNQDAVRMFAAIGFRTEAVLKDMVRDQRDRPHNLAIMVNDVTSLSQTLDDWIQDSMVPAYRVPGMGA
jgi:RimJ/RimL family protein N-acetyltransferase